MTNLGLTTLHESPPGVTRETAYVDIVAIHGIGSSQTEAWTHPQTGTVWLRDLLPFKILPSRILLFGYKADVLTFFGDDSANRILQHAHTLVAELEAVRALSNSAERPIIFVCHGLGGIIAKKALAYSATQTSKKVDHLYSIFISTYGILFMGTPHNGMEPAAWQALAHGTRVKKMFSSGLPNMWAKDSETLQNITDQFAPLMKQFYIYLFWEGIETDLGFTKGYLVREDSAAPIWNNTERSRIHATHSQMCKFADKESADFKTVVAALCRYARDAQAVVGPRWINARRLFATQRSIEASELIGFDAHNHNAPFVCESPKLYQRPWANKIHNKHFHVPHNVSSIYTGRDIVTKVLQRKLLGSSQSYPLHQQKRFVLYGLGGSGKTQFCLKFVQDYRDRFWGIFWVDASSVENAERALSQLGRLGGLDENCSSGMHWLTNLENPWLLVIDNADDPSVDYSKFFPAGDRGHILVTSRNSDCRIHATVGSYEFNNMDEEDAITLLLRATEADDVHDARVRNVARPITKALGNLALALIQAGASIRQGICPLESYLEFFALYKKQIMGDQLAQGADNYRYTIYTTWEVSVQMIENLSSENAEDAVHILQIFAFLHFEHVPISMFETAWNKRREGKVIVFPKSLTAKILEIILSVTLLAQLYSILSSLQSIYTYHRAAQQLPEVVFQKSPTWNAARFQKAIRMLANYSLITQDIGGNTYSMHPMVHSWAQERLDERQQDFWSDIAISVLADSISPNLEASRQQYRRSLVPHMDSCLQRERTQNILKRKDRLTQIPKTVRFAGVYAECGKWAKAIALQEDVLQVLSEALGPEHPETLQAMTALSSSFWNFKRPSEALKLQRQVMESSSETMGADDPRTLKAMDTLAATYWLCGKRREAELLGEKAVKGMERTLGHGHPDTLTAQENLGRTYMHRGRYEAARDLQRGVLESRRKMYGPSNPDTLMAMANLGMTYHALGSFADAEKLLEAVTETRQRVLGQEHAYTLWAINDLSKIYLDQGHATEAEEMLRDILEIVTRTLGNDHIGMSMTMMNLARAVNGQGKWADGQQILTDLIQMQQRTLGPEHPDTLAAKAELARSVKHLGDLRTAETMFLEAIDKMTHVLGAKHVWTQRAIGQLSAIYIAQNRMQEAEELDSRLRH